MLPGREGLVADYLNVYLSPRSLGLTLAKSPDKGLCLLKDACLLRCICYHKTEKSIGYTDTFTFSNRVYNGAYVYLFV